MTSQTQRENAFKGEREYSEPDFAVGDIVTISAGLYGSQDTEPYEAIVKEMRYTENFGAKRLSMVILKRVSSQQEVKINFDPGNLTIIKSPTPEIQ